MILSLAEIEAWAAARGPTARSVVADFLADRQSGGRVEYVRVSGGERAEWEERRREPAPSKAAK